MDVRELVPQGWEPDLGSGLIFFVIEVVLVVILLPLYLKRRDRREQRRLDRRTWQAPRQELVRILADCYAEVVDGLILLNWALRSWEQRASGGGARGLAVGLHPLVGRQLQPLHNDLVGLLTQEMPLDTVTFSQVANEAARHIHNQCQRALTAIDVYSITINSDMAQTLGKILRYASDTQSAAILLQRFSSIFDVIEAMGGDGPAAAAVPAREDAAPSQARRMVGEALSVRIVRFTKEQYEPRIQRADAISFASQVRECVFTTAHGIVLLSRLAELYGSRESQETIRRLRSRGADEAFCTQLVAAGDTLADMFMAAEVRLLMGVGQTLETPPPAFVRHAFEAASYAASKLLPEPEKPRPPNDAAYWLAGFALGIVALFALFAAAYPSNGFSYWEGLMLCVLATAAVFALIKFRFDRVDQIARK